MRELKPATERLPVIFICYRRADTGDFARGLREALKAQFRGRALVFLDHDDIPKGVNFDKLSKDIIAGSNALVAIIGRQWLALRDEKSGERRLDNAADHVRAEITTALARNVRIFPVLAHGAEMPRKDELPDDLKPLADLNAQEFSDRTWQDDFRRLAGALETALPRKAADPGPIFAGYDNYDHKDWWEELREAFPFEWSWRAAFAVLVLVAVPLAVISIRSYIIEPGQEGTQVTPPPVNPAPEVSLGDEADTTVALTLLRNGAAVADEEVELRFDPAGGIIRLHADAEGRVLVPAKYKGLRFRVGTDCPELRPCQLYYAPSKLSGDELTVELTGGRATSDE